MSFVSKHFEFMQPVLTAQDLGLPTIEPGEIDGQPFDLKPGDRLLLFSEGRQQYSETRFKEWLQLTRNSKKVAICWFPRRTEPVGVRIKTWTASKIQAEALTILDRAE